MIVIDPGVGYRYKLSSQNGDKIRLDNKSDDGDDVASGVGSILTGSGNKFTLYGSFSGKSEGVNYTTIEVISGEKTATVIKDFKDAFIIKSKTGDDFDAVLLPVGTGRIWYEADSLASTISTFRMQQVLTSAKGAHGKMSVFFRK